MDDVNNNDFASLSPDLVLDALEELGYRVDGRILALNSYENRVYQIYLEDGSLLISKFYRPGRWTNQQICEEHSFAAQLAEAEIPVVAPLSFNHQTLHHHQQHRFSLFRRQQGRPPELSDEDTLSWMGRYLGRIHHIGKQNQFLHRPALNPLSYGVAALDFLQRNRVLPGAVRGDYFDIAQRALDQVQLCYEKAGALELIRTHGDCHWGNVLWADSGEQAGPWFVDFDDARNAPALQDIWMLLSGSRREMTQQLSIIVDAYEDFTEFDYQQLHILEALRTLRLIHYSSWLAQRWCDPAFPVAFPWFGSDDYWRARIQELSEQIELMRLPALSI